MASFLLMRTGSPSCGSFPVFSTSAAKAFSPVWIISILRGEYMKEQHYGKV
jgi:hypothetical protein